MNHQGAFYTCTLAHLPTCSLAPQCLNRIQLRRLGGRIVAEEDAHRRRGNEGQRDGFRYQFGAHRPKAKEIGTFDTSILAEKFYCQEFLAKHPETKANLEKVKKEERKLDVEKLIKEAVKKAKVEII